MIQKHSNTNTFIISLTSGENPFAQGAKGFRNMTTDSYQWSFRWYNVQKYSAAEICGTCLPQYPRISGTMRFCWKWRQNWRQCNDLVMLIFALIISNNWIHPKAVSYDIVPKVGEQWDTKLPDPLYLALAKDATYGASVRRLAWTPLTHIFRLGAFLSITGADGCVVRVKPEWFLGTISFVSAILNIRS